MRKKCKTARPERRRSRLWWFLLLLWLGIIFILSSQPYQKQDLRPFLSEHVNHAWMEEKLGDWRFFYEGREISIATKGVPAFLEFLLRKAAHMLSFGFLAAIVWFVLNRRWSYLRWKAYPVAFLITILAAMLDEFHQYFVPGRLASWTDVMIDGVGALFALLLIGLLQSLRSIILCKGRS